MRQLFFYILFWAFFMSGPVENLYSQASCLHQAVGLDSRFLSHRPQPEVDPVWVNIPEELGEMDPFTSDFTQEGPDLASADTSRSLVLEKIGGVYRFNFFPQPWVRRWHVAGLRTDWNYRNTPVIGSVNYGTLAGGPIDGDSKVNWQFQLEAYPRITSSDYMYLSAAYSGSSLFPRHYYGGEWFHSFQRGFEASAGVRWMQWEESIWFYTGSIGKYLGNYWFALRAYITPGEKATGQTYTLSARKYLATGKDYLGVKLEYGNSPDNLSYLLDFPDIRRLNSMGVHLSWQRELNRWLLYVNLGYRREEYQNDAYRGHFSTRLHLLYKLDK